MLALWTKAVAYFNDEERGATMVEYALMVALIAVVAIIVISIVGKETSNTFKTVGDSMGAAAA